MTEETRFFAFISYNEADRKWAEWLQSKLEYYHIPVDILKQHPDMPKQIRPVFWYKKDLSGTKLMSALEDNLLHSKFLIVVCSPNSAKSEWVRKEVSTFLAQGKGDRIIPFVVGGTPHASDPEEECFPPELRDLPKEEEIRGIDVRRKEGKNHALVDVVATLLGISFDSLWGRHKRRQKKIRNICIGSAFAVLLAIAGIIDYTRPKYEYFADYVDSWGLAQGVVPLGKDQVSHRNRSYRFEYRRIPFGQPDAYSWRLAKVAYINSSGIPQEQESLERRDRYPVLAYDYSKSAGNLIRINCCSEDGRIIMRHNLSEHDGKAALLVDFGSAFEDQGSAFIGSRTSSVTRGALQDENIKSRIKRYAYERNSQGHITKVSYHCNNDDDLQSSIVSDGDNIFGLSYVLDSIGRPVEMRYIDDKGRPCATKTGVSGRKYTYDAFSNIVRVQYIDEQGKPTLNEMYWSEKKTTTDAYGNELGWTVFSPDGNPCYSTDGYAGEKYSFDSKGNITRTTFTDPGGKPCSNSTGVAHVTRDYNSKGYPVRMRFFDTEDRPCYSTNGISDIRWKYDSRGKTIEEAFFDTEGNPCLNNSAYSKVVIKYDTRGNVIEENYFGTDGKPCMSADGVAKIVYAYDSRDLNTEKSYYDTDGKPCFSAEGFAKVIYTYDSRGNNTGESFYDTDGKPCNHRFGIAAVAWKFDSQGNMVEFASFDDKGQPCNLFTGYSIARFKYDSRGNTLEISIFDTEGKPCMTPSIPATIANSYDSKGNLIEQTFYDEQGRKYPFNGNVASSRNSYDARGNVIRVDYFDTKGRLCLSPRGFATSTYIYDSKNNCLQRSYFGTKGEAVKSKEDLHKAVNVYNEAGEFVEEITYDERGAEKGRYLPTVAVTTAFPSDDESDPHLGSAVIKWNGWTLGDTKDKLVREMQKVIPTQAVFRTKEGELTALELPLGKVGLEFEDYMIEKSTAEEIVTQMEDIL